MGSWELDLRSGETLWSGGMYRILGLPFAEQAHDRAESTSMPMTMRRSSSALAPSTGGTRVRPPVASSDPIAGASYPLGSDRR